MEPPIVNKAATMFGMGAGGTIGCEWYRVPATQPDTARFVITALTCDAPVGPMADPGALQACVTPVVGRYFA